ncbi:hypothetical protein UPYG_G00306640 [Umbra pygmaea]|uniref:Fibronectin type-III domain-containing protein n=1 Tax=Umbra pygmaea TaxID=75934 RepID=A0ABD0VYP3_UMBPY
MQRAHTFLHFFFLVSIAGMALASLSTARRSRVRRQNMKVKINATGDTIVMKFLHPNPDTKLEGYIMGYGSNMFSNQIIHLPKDGIPIQTEIDAEPKYLIVVQPIPAKNVKRECTGRVDLEKPLHLVIGSVSPSSVKLSWGTLLQSPYENVMVDCLENSQYNIRYRENNKTWNYQTCPTSKTVIDDLKPNTLYDFGVQPKKEERNGPWSEIVTCKTNTGERLPQKPKKPRTSLTPLLLKPIHSPLFPPHHAVLNTSLIRPVIRAPAAPRTTFAPTSANRQPSLATPRPTIPLVQQKSMGQAAQIRFDSSPSVDVTHSSSTTPDALSAVPRISSTVHRASSEDPSASSIGPHHPRTRPHTRFQFPSSTNLPLTSTSDPESASDRHGHRHWGAGQGRSRPRPDQPAKVILTQQTPTAPSRSQVGPALPGPALATPRANNKSQGASPKRPLPPAKPRKPTATRNETWPRYPSSPPSRPKPTRPFRKGAPTPNGEGQRGFAIPRPSVPTRKPGSKAVPRPLNPKHPIKKRPNLPKKPINEGSKAVPRPLNPKDLIKNPNLPKKPVNEVKFRDQKLKDKVNIFKGIPQVTAKPTKQKTTTLPPTLNATTNNSLVFSSLPASEVDALGKKRFVGPNVVYKTDKKPDEPCSITNSLSLFPEEERLEINVTAPPRFPPSNVTVLTVEGCPSFVIVDWNKGDNETTEYEVTSRTEGPDGEEVSITKTNQTHTAVENLKPDSRYAFEVKSKNELGASPASDPVAFSTESADPRVSENMSGKAAIWTQFPFKADSYSECTGKMYVKRTWYRKFVGIQLCNSLRYKIYMSDSLTGKFYNIGDQTGHGEDHCQFVDSFLDGRTGTQLLAEQLPNRKGFYRAMRQEPVSFGEIGGNSHTTYVAWYECGTPIPGKW